MSLDFPNTPIVGDVFSAAGSTWHWDGAKWGPKTKVIVTEPGSVINVLDHGAVGDGVTNDTAAIQSVLNTYSGKAIIYIPNTGSQYMTTGLSIRSGTHLILDGVIKALPNITAGVVSGVSVNNIAISGSGTIDGNKDAQATHPGGMAGLALHIVGNARVSGITLQNAYHWNMNVTASTNVVFEGVTMVGGGNANEFAAGCNNCWLTNCVIVGANMNDYAFCFYGGVTNSGAIGNVIRDAGLNMTGGPPGIGVMSDTPQPAPCRDIVIANNIIYNCAAGGITILGTSTGATQTGIVVSGNRCYNNGRNATPAAQVADCYVNYASDIKIIGNQFSAFGGNGALSNGVYLGPEAKYIDLSDNQIFNVGKGGSGGASAMWINSPDFIRVSNNYIYDNQATHTMAWAVIGTAGTQNLFFANYFGVPHSFTHQADTVMANYGLVAFDTVGFRVQFDQPTMYKKPGSNSARWYMGVSGAEPGGDNTGSNFFIAAVWDTGGLQSSGFAIDRATNKTTIAKLNLSNLPTSATGLTTGDVWRGPGNVLNIV